MAGSSGYEHKLQDSDVTNVGVKASQSDGLAMDSKGLLFYGDLSSNAVSYWNSSASSYLNSSNGNLLVQNDIDLQWPDTFAFDNNGYLYATTNRIHRFISNSYDLNDINFRVIRVYIGTKSYQHSASEAVANIALVVEMEGAQRAQQGATKYPDHNMTLFQQRAPKPQPFLPLMKINRPMAGPKTGLSLFALWCSLLLLLICSLNFIENV